MSARAGPACVGLGRAFHDLHPDAEDRFAGEAPRRRPASLHSCRVSWRGEARIQLGARRQAAEEIGIQQRIHDGGIARQIGRQARRRAHDLGQQIQELRPRQEQREKLHARRQVGEEAVELGEGDIGIGGARQRLQDRRHQLGQKLARPLRCAWRGCGHDASRGWRPRHAPASAKAHRRQGLQGFGIFLDAGEDQIALRAGQIRLALEQPGIMALHILQHRASARRENRRRCHSP